MQNTATIIQHKRVEDILLDDSFYRWYLQTKEEDIVRWNNWISADFKNRLLVEEAIVAMNRLSSQKDERGFPKKVHAIFSRLQKAASFQTVAA